MINEIRNSHRFTMIQETSNSEHETFAFIMNRCEFTFRGEVDSYRKCAAVT